MSIGRGIAVRAGSLCRMAGSMSESASSKALPAAWAGWAKMDVPAQSGIVRPLLAAVPPGGLPRMAACGWLSPAAADAMGVALAVFKGVDNFDDFVDKPGSNIVQVASREAKRLGISEGMSGEEALRLLESAPPSDEEVVASKIAADATTKVQSESHEVFDGWTTAELPVSTGLPKPLLVAVPPGGKPRMAACGWIDPETADKLEVSLVVFKGVGQFRDFAVEAAATSNVVKATSKAAEDLGIVAGNLGEAALAKLVE